MSALDEIKFWYAYNSHARRKYLRGILRLPKEEILKADEIFISSTSRRVWPVHRIEDRNLGEVPGPVSSKLSAIMDSIQTGRDEQFRHWLYPIQPNLPPSESTSPRPGATKRKGR